MKFEKITNGLHLYHRYPGQTVPQGTYIELDIEEDPPVLRADWNGEIGNAVPECVWNGRVRRYHLPSAYLSAKAINDLLEEVAPLADRVVAGAEVVFSPQGNRTVKLTEDAKDAEATIDECLSRSEDLPEIQVWDAKVFFQDAIPTLKEWAVNKTDDELVEFLVSEAVEIDVLEGLDNLIREIRD